MGNIHIHGHGRHSGWSGSHIKDEDAMVREYIKQAKIEFNNKFSTVSTSNAKFEDYFIFRTLGTGAFGRVMLVKYNVDEQYYAMKILDKGKIVKKRQVEHTLMEKRIMASLSFPFLVTMFHHFKNNSYLYLIMEFVGGGELFYHLQKHRKFTEKQSRFYAGQVVLAFQYLHCLDLIYRDLKPENIVVDHNGYIKLTDFGFTKRVVGRTYTMCGTPEYMAPELLENRGYGKSVDWWAFGVLVYEMNVGEPPYRSSDQMELHNLITHGRLIFPKWLSPPLRDIISRLLDKDPSKRIGCLKNGADDVKHFRWFDTINWIALYKKEGSAPFIPKCGGKGDSGNFVRQAEVDLIISDADLYEKEFAEF